MAKKISVIIPNYNGRKLLEKNLPKVIENCPGVEIIVVDDASTDGSQIYLKSQKPKINLIENSKNLGFAKTANKGAKFAKGDLILFLNTDVEVNSNFINIVLNYFKNKSIFAVGLADLSHESNKVVTRGRGTAAISRGFLIHSKREPKAGKTFWVSGGSGLFDKGKFLQLGGFDDIFSPFYWEDIDLSYRAYKSGYRCIFEPNAKVRHFHEEGAIKTNYAKSRIKSISYRNQFIFFWKNIDDYTLVAQHILWLPYHFVKAIFSSDWAFFIGFFLAIIKLPRLVFNSSLAIYSPRFASETGHLQLSDREVIEIANQ